jgi:hypothetical protein
MYFLNMRVVFVVCGLMLKEVLKVGVLKDDCIGLCFLIWVGLG